MTFALFELGGALTRLPWVSLGDWPTPVQRLGELTRFLGRDATELFVKRDDASSPIYGGNKVRTLELLLGHALSLQATRVQATGAFGSNHALATALHAPRVGLAPGAILFPQPPSLAALDNLRALCATDAELLALPHAALLPFAIAFKRWLAADRNRTYVMLPGGATPRGALGYVAAGLELARQIERGELPIPGRIWVGVGSTCTSAGLLVGLALAAHLRLGFDARRRPALTSVRVTPWPITARFRILGLAERTARWLSELSGGKLPAFERSQLGARFAVDGRFLGPGYGQPSPGAVEAERIWAELGLFALDGTYSAKAAAALVHAVRAGDPGPHLFWSTKSSAPLPTPQAPRAAPIPLRMRHWLARAERELSS